MSKQITFYVATNLDYYGDGASQETVDDYTEFATEYLENLGYEVEIEEVEDYGHYGEYDPRNQNALREVVWSAYCNQ